MLQSPQPFHKHPTASLERRFKNHTTAFGACNGPSKLHSIFFSTKYLQLVSWDFRGLLELLQRDMFHCYPTTAKTCRPLYSIQLGIKNVVCVAVSSHSTSSPWAAALGFASAGWASSWSHGGQHMKPSVSLCFYSLLSFAAHKLIFHIGSLWFIPPVSGCGTVTHITVTQPDTTTVISIALFKTVGKLKVLGT